MNNRLLTAAIEVDGQWHGTDSSEFTLQIFTEVEDMQMIRATFTNNSDKTVCFGGFRFDLAAWDDVQGPRIRIYREGWTMTSAAASVRYGECDFEADPDYLKYAVTNPEEYSCSIQNHFSAEHVAVLNDSKTDNCILAGFVTSADQLTRLTIELNESGVSHFSAFSSGDGIEVDPGEKIESEELIIFEGSNGYFMLQKYADIWGQRMNALSWPHVPTGWCSWYYYFSDVTEKDMLENIDFLREHREEYPLEYIQLDAGYESANGDWLTCNEKFPGGLKFLADKTREAGFKPAIWLAPFMVDENSELFKNHPDWMVHDSNGKIINITPGKKGPRVALDGTHPEAQEYLRKVFSTLVEYGYEYVKLDFMVYACCGTGGAYYDRKATRAQALRRGLAVIREAMQDKFILGCTTPLGQVIGLVNGERIGTDITPYWRPDRKIYKEAPTIPNVCRNMINRCYMNGRLWVSDPDTHIARSDNNKLTENEVILWTYALYLTGGMMLLSDRFETLSPERAKLSKMLLAKPSIPDTRPLDIFDREFPAVWLRRDRDTDRILAGLFNLEDKDQELELDFDKVKSDVKFTVKDFISGEELQETNSKLMVTVAPHSCRIFELNS